MKYVTACALLWGGLVGLFLSLQSLGSADAADFKKPKIVKPKILKPKVVRPRVIKPKLAKPKIHKPKFKKPNIPSKKLAKPRLVNRKIIVKKRAISKNRRSTVSKSKKLTKPIAKAPAASNKKRRRRATVAKLSPVPAVAKKQATAKATLNVNKPSREIMFSRIRLNSWINPGDAVVRTERSRPSYKGFKLKVAPALMASKSSSVDVLIAEMPGTILNLPAGINNLKESGRGAQLFAPGSASSELAGLGEAGLDARPGLSGNNLATKLLTPEGSPTKAAGSGTETIQDARGPGYGLSNEEKLAALEGGKLPGNLGRSRATKQPSQRTQQNNTGSNAIGRLLGSKGSGSRRSERGTFIGGASDIAGGRVMGDDDIEPGTYGDTPILLEVANAADSVVKVLDEATDVVSDIDGVVGAIGFAAKNPLLAASAAFSAGWRLGRRGSRAIDQHESTRNDIKPPECAGAYGPGCDGGQIVFAGLGVDLTPEEVYDNYRRRSAFSREWTGQPSPHEDPKGSVDEASLPGSPRPYISGVDPDCIAAKCGDNEFNSNNVGNRHGSVFRMLDWQVQGAPQ